MSDVKSVTNGLASRPPIVAVHTTGKNTRHRTWGPVWQGGQSDRQHVKSDSAQAETTPGAGRFKEKRVIPLHVMAGGQRATLSSGFRIQMKSHPHTALRQAGGTVVVLQWDTPGGWQVSGEKETDSTGKGAGRAVRCDRPVISESA